MLIPVGKVIHPKSMLISPSLQSGKQLANISVPVTGHEQHVHILELVLCVAPFQLREFRPGKDETVEDHGRVLQPLPTSLIRLWTEPSRCGAFVQ